ncbi:hypothetical protein K450DRAFT_237654 [Umbelopsis ramanniana AG]|uniref:Response regulatory domain-containing protein n=1 Tax=Umbelopsis ramanniana AG TaxID=1314678 RepID=A0AAD5EAB6_UMBRA|nr:uncharacterized protein K450DRAFT_237654 [Umbelopsis ramanniana AG]KAI8580266.1 hypothetical protein K450DRAFT_237654 [Umbelopsis ramanniana AG]
MTLNIRNLDSSSEDVKSQSGDDSGTLGIDIEIALIPCAESQAKVEEICKSDFLPNQIELLRGTVEVAGSAEEGRQAVEIFFEAPQRSEDNAYPVPTDLSNLDGDSEGYHALENFYELLKDMKIALYAMENSHFAKHLTNCLTNWSMNITHFSINELRQQLDSVGSDRTLKDAVSSPPTTSVSYPHQAPFPVSPGSPYTSPATTENERYDTTDAKFIIIDDDIPTLKRQIMNRQAAVASDASIRPRTSNRRTKGGFNGRLDIRYPEISPQSTIIFFTSLKNYKQVREIMMSNVNPWSKQSYALAHIVAVPKPACPRRILTALFTAWNKKSVDPQFTPIASLPTSPLTSNSSYSSQSNYQEHMSPPTPHGDGYIMVDSNGRKHERGIDSPLARDTETGHYFSPSYSTLHPSMGNSLKNHASPAGMVVDEGMLFVPGNRTPHSLPRTKNPTKKSQLSPKAQSPTKQDKFLEAPHPNETSADYNASGIPKTRTPYTNSNEFLNGGSPAHMAVGDDLSSKVSDTSTCKSGTSPITIVTDTTHSRNTTPDLDDKLGDAMPPVDGPLPTPHLTGDMQVDYQKQAPDQLQPPKLPDKATLRRASLKRKKKLSLNKSVSPSIQVLIVEDNIINQVILSKWMKNHGIKYEVASNGQEAFDKWSQGAFHLILMDIQLPVMDGITCTKKIRAVEKENKLQQMQQSLHREVPRSLSFDTLGSMEEKATEFRSPVIIVALTASSLDSDRQEALAAGCNDFLTKPVSMEWLDRKITEWGCMQALIDYEGWRQWREAKQSATSNQVVDDKQPDIISKPVQPERKASSSTNRSGVMMKGGSAIKPPSQRSATS